MVDTFSIMQAFCKRSFRVVEVKLFHPSHVCRGCRHVSKPFKSSEEVYLDLICLAPNLLNLI